MFSFRVEIYSVSFWTDGVPFGWFYCSCASSAFLRLISSTLSPFC